MAGDLKLDYAQFEELETFARFGVRLDEDTRKIIEHGRRIREVIKQPEFSSVSVPVQIAILLALTSELFDKIPLDSMNEAVQAVYDAATDIPSDVCDRFETAAELDDKDRKTIIEIVSKALISFQPEPDIKVKEKPKTDVKNNGKEKKQKKQKKEKNKKTKKLIRKPHE